LSSRSHKLIFSARHHAIALPANRLQFKSIPTA
jgi:hypothetical protein